MNKTKKALCVLMGIVVFSVPNVEKVSAFQAASHYTLIENVASNLPKNSVIRKAIQNNPNIAAWGSVGPDLGYAQVRALGDYAPWADRYHYDKIGTFSANLLKNALKSKDQKQIAFAAGWVSHVCGDMACHGEYVNPECGVYLDRTDTRKLHSKLEKNAEPYVWSTLGNIEAPYNKSNLSDIFSNKKQIPYGLLKETTKSVYQTTVSKKEVKKWVKIFSIGIETGVGYKYISKKKAMKILNQNNRKERLTNAFQTAKSKCTTLLKQAEKGDYHNFSDRWNLDVGQSQSPISTITVSVKTGTKSKAGTDDDIFFGIETKSGKTKEWLLDMAGYNDFEKGDNDDYYLYINDEQITPSSISHVYFKKKHLKNSNGESWYFEQFKVDANGVNVCSEKPQKWLKGNKVVRFASDWSAVKNISDPAF